MVSGLVVVVSSGEGGVCGEGGVRGEGGGVPMCHHHHRPGVATRTSASSSWQAGGEGGDGDGSSEFSMRFSLKVLRGSQAQDRGPRRCLQCRFSASCISHFLRPSRKLSHSMRSSMCPCMCTPRLSIIACDGRFSRTQDSGANMHLCGPTSACLLILVAIGDLSRHLLVSPVPCCFRLPCCTYEATSH